MASTPRSVPSRVSRATEWTCERSLPRKRSIALLMKLGSEEILTFAIALTDSGMPPLE